MDSWFIFISFSYVCLLVDDESWDISYCLQCGWGAFGLCGALIARAVMRWKPERSPGTPRQKSVQRYSQVTTN